MERDVDNLDAGSRKRKGLCNGGLHEPPGDAPALSILSEKDALNGGPEGGR